MYPLNRDGCYPEVAVLIRLLTHARVEGKELGKRRPATLIKIELNFEGRPFVVEIKPALRSSPTGWVVPGYSTIRLVDMFNRRRGLSARISKDGKVHVSNWYRNIQEFNRRDTSVLWSAMELLSRDPAAIVNRRADNCGLCGRGLTDEVSQYRGIGPECWSLWDRVYSDITDPGSEFNQCRDTALLELRREMQKWHPDRPDGDADKFMAARQQFEQFTANYK